MSASVRGDVPICLLITIGSIIMTLAVKVGRLALCGSALQRA